MLLHLTDYLVEPSLSIFDNLEFLIRILLSAFLGILVGLERTKRQKEAGVRTHCIIACSAAVFMILSKYAFLDIGAVMGAKDSDPARIAAQIVSGISFLGAGVIFKNGNGIRGLTTAAGIWATAAIGMAVGAGMYWVGIIETVILMVAQFVLHLFPIGGDSLSVQKVSVSMKDDPNLLSQFEEFVAHNNGRIAESSIQAEDNMLSISVTIRIPEPIVYEEALSFLKNHPGVNRISVS